MRWILILSISAFLLSACKGPKEASQSTEENKPFKGTGWELVEAFGESIALPDRSRIPHFVLNEKDNLFHGNTGCNQMFGQYGVYETGFGFREVASTEMYCESTAQIELDFLNVMQQVNKYEVKGSELYFFKDEELIARFKSMQKVPGQE